MLVSADETAELLVTGPTPVSRSSSPGAGGRSPSAARGTRPRAGDRPTSATRASGRSSRAGVAAGSGPSRFLTVARSRVRRRAGMVTDSESGRCSLGGPSEAARAQASHAIANLFPGATAGRLSALRLQSRERPPAGRHAEGVIRR